MKDEELAEEYVKGNEKVYYHPNGVPIFTREEEMKFAFLAGLKAGRPQWHDLRKDPNVLPKEENRIMLCYCCIGYHGNIGTYVYRLYTKKEFHKVIAWCEIPTFDKE